jgi:hypothetical protein
MAVASERARCAEIVRSAVPGGTTFYWVKSPLEVLREIEQTERAK